nr:MAG TPA: hypothetical protein [Caudoviricetes sp.]
MITFAILISSKYFVLWGLALYTYIIPLNEWYVKHFFQKIEKFFRREELEVTAGAGRR